MRLSSDNVSTIQLIYTRDGFNILIGAGAHLLQILCHAADDLQAGAQELRLRYLTSDLEFELTMLSASQAHNHAQYPKWNKPNYEK